MWSYQGFPYASPANIGHTIVKVVTAAAAVPSGESNSLAVTVQNRRARVPHFL